MAVKFIKERKKQRHLIGAFVAVLIIGGVVLWLGYFRKEKPIREKTAVVVSPKEIKINLEVLENPFLKELQPFVGIPPFLGEKGRENPFLPY